MKRKFINGLLLVALMFASTSAFVSCKDYEEENYSDLLSKLGDTNKSLRDYVDLKIAGLQGEIDAMKLALQPTRDSLKWAYDSVGRVKSCYCDLSKIGARIDSLNAVLAAIPDNQGNTWTLVTIANALEKAQADLASLYRIDAATFQGVLDRLTALENKPGVVVPPYTPYNDSALWAKIDSLKALPHAAAYDETSIVNRIVVLEQTMYIWSDSLKQAYTDAAFAKGLAERDSARIDSLRDAFNEVDFDSYVTRPELKDSLNNLWARTQALADEYLDSAMTALKNTNEVLNLRIDKVIEAYAAADDKLNDRIDSLNNALTPIKNDIQKNATRIDKIEEAMKLHVTSVIVQDVYNPVFGDITTPFGLNTTVLAAFYGKATTDFEFPYLNNMNDYYLSEDYIARADLAPEIEALGDIQGSIDKVANQILLGGNGNAGKLYVTINPNTTNFSGKVVELVNSQDKAAPVSLTPLVRSDHVKGFGWTKAADNGFYEADATISVENIKSGDTKARVNFNNSVNDIKAFVAKPNRGSLTTAAKSFLKDSYQSMGNILDANAVKATYTDFQGNHSVYSDYNVAVTTIYPLSFNTGNGLHVTTLPGVSRLKNVVDNAFGSVKKEISGALNISTGSIDLTGMTFDFNLDADQILSGINFQVSIDAIDKTIPGTVWTYDPSGYVYNADGTYSANTYHYEYDPTTGIYTIIKAYGIESKNYQKGDYLYYTNWYDRYILADNTVYNSWTEWNAAGAPDYVKNEWGEEIVQYTAEDVKNSGYINGVGYLTEDGSDYVLHIDAQNVNLNPQIRQLVEKLNAQLASSTANVNTKLAELSAFADDINDMLSQVSSIKTKVSTSVDNIAVRINSAIDRINNRAVSYINRLNNVMQPIMLVESANGPARLSQMFSSPSHLTSNNLQLLPTTMNGELLAPAYKKFVAVLKAIKNDGSNANDAAEAKRLNEDNDLLKVFDGGGKKAVKVEGLKSGYIYEIVYMAADYRGLVAARKYYVTVD